MRIYNLMKLGPTSANGCPLRIIFVQSAAEKEKLCKVMMDSNVEKVKSSPVTAIFAYDLNFYEKMDKLYPTGKMIKDYFSSLDESARTVEAMRNSSLQAAYFMMAARNEGVDCGPMSGLDYTALNEAFFKGTNYRANFTCNLGYRDGDNPYPKLPRLDFDETCEIR